MSDYTTHFPPQTYSSSFYINSLVDGEKPTIFAKTNNADGGTKGAPLLDCFISAMSKVFNKIQKLFYVWVLLPILAADASVMCKMENLNKTAKFSSLLDLQANRNSFDPDDRTYQGNVVEFGFKSIDRLQRNSFISFGSRNIIKIDLNNKGIRTIDDGAFNELFCLHYLELRSNNLSNLTAGIFNGLVNLRLLDLTENELQRISQNGMVFNSLHKLKILNLSKNNIAVLNTSDFCNLTALEVLNLSFNKISDIPSNVFNSLCSLKKLHLNNNKLRNVEPEQWKNLNYLEVLNLAGNFLSKFVPRNNFSFVDLRILNVSRNYLTNLNVISLRKSLRNLEVLDISVNDWHCDNLEVMKFYLADHKVTVIDDGNCRGSKAYKAPIIETPPPTTTSIHTSTTSTLKNNNSGSVLKQVCVQNDEVLSTTNKILQKVQKLQTLLGYLCAIFVVLVMVNIAVRIGLCQNLYNRLTGRPNAGDGNDRERMILLRP